jgi:hypothetical protein
MLDFPELLLVDGKIVRWRTAADMPPPIGLHDCKRDNGRHGGEGYPQEHRQTGPALVTLDIKLAGTLIKSNRPPGVAAKK